VSHNLIDYRGELCKQIDGTDENINRTIKDTFTHYYRSLNDDFYKKNSRINFNSYIEIGRNIIKKFLDVNPILFTPPFDDISKNNLNLISSLGMILNYGQSNY
jgi:hypothetical protein